jgi:hypothetical protein
MSKDWTQRPSSLLGIDDPYAAWCVDEVVYLFGNYCEGEMDQAEHRTKQQAAKGPARARTLANILNGTNSVQEDEAGQTKELPAPATAGRFRDPAAMFKK